MYCHEIVILQYPKTIAAKNWIVVYNRMKMWKNNLSWKTDLEFLQLIQASTIIGFYDEANEVTYPTLIHRGSNLPYLRYEYPLNGN